MQQTFLEDIAQELYKELGEGIAEWQIIFPNRRAGLFFNRALRKLIQKPIWAPEVMAIEDYVRKQSHFAVPDQLSLVFSLHEVFQKHAPFKEDFEQFYFWGDLLVKDFGDVDHYMANAKPLFSNLLEWKKLANTDFLEPEQISLIERFWKSFEAKPQAAQEKFTRNWDILLVVYQDFKLKLNAEQKAYSGMLYRDIAEKIISDQIQLDSKLVFAGFNALTKTEEVIISAAVKEGAKIFWDIDAYYAAPEMQMQEAGNFYRAYAKHSVLGKTFPKEMPNNIIDNPAKIDITEVKGNIAQAKFLGQLLQHEKLEFPEQTAIILGDESLLFPVLYALPKEIKKINVTMGYPMRFASVYQLMSTCLQLQKNTRSEKSKLSFNHRDVLKILKHPYIGNLLKDTAKKNIQQIERQNMIRVSLKELQGAETEILQLIFQDATQNYFSYLKRILQYVHAEKLAATEQEFIAEIFKQINQLEQIIEQFKLKLDINSFIRLFNRIIQSIRVPFSGEPLEGLQIMGVLESRNLDFQQVYFLSMSEDNFPGGASIQSFIPYNIRKAYGLPTLEQRDAIYAYLFYRLLQRSQKLHLMYNSDNSGGKGGEPSRYLLQLQYELGLQTDKINQQILNQDTQAATAVPIVVPKDVEIWNILSSYSEPDKRTLSASALKTYLNCRLQFYFRYVAGLKEREEVTEELDAADFGNILHHVMEKLYQDFIGQKLEKQEVIKLKSGLVKYIEEEFRNEFGKKDEPFVFEGRNIIIRDVVKRMIEQILDYDASVAPFFIHSLEGAYTYEFPVTKGKSVFMKGFIDRLDQVDERIRVIDYKSGGDEVTFPDVSSLFDREHPKRNGAAMQTIFYAYLYYKNSNLSKELQLSPGLYNGKGLFQSNFSEYLKMDKKVLQNILPIIDDFEIGLQSILAEIFVSDQPFDQTHELLNCQYCEFKTICNRK